MTEATQPPSLHPHRSAMAALCHKEWQEQRWRFALGTLVLSGILAGLLRAQMIPYNEAALIVYWIVGIALTVFLAMGPVASEKGDGTWCFLLSQPVSRADVLLAKWRVALLQLVGILLIATLAGALAMWSRGFAGMTSILAEVPPEQRSGWSLFADIAIDHPVTWLFTIALVSGVSLACWLTELFFVLARARNEFTAALAGLLLTVILHLWLAASFGVRSFDGHATLGGLSNIGMLASLFNPLCPLALAFAPGKQGFALACLAFDVLLWIVLPVWLVKRTASRAAHR